MKTLKFDMGQRMGFVISHNQESFLVHVISLTEGGQAERLGVQVGWIINKIEDINLTDLDVDPESEGDTRTQVVKEVVVKNRTRFCRAEEMRNSAIENGEEPEMSEQDLENIRYMSIEFLIPEEASDVPEDAKSAEDRRASMAFDGKIAVQFHDEAQAEMRAVKDLPQMKPILLRKKNPGVTGSKDKWLCLHKFALYYSNKKLDYEALEAFDSEVDKDGTRKRLNASTSVIPVKHIVECRVSNNKKLVIILANKRVVTFKRREGTDVDLFEWADVILDHKHFYSAIHLQEQNVGTAQDSATE